MLKEAKALLDSALALVHKVLSSRKAMAAIVAISGALADHRPDLAVAAAAAYMGVEGYVDSKTTTV